MNTHEKSKPLTGIPLMDTPKSLPSPPPFLRPSFLSENPSFFKPSKCDYLTSLEKPCPTFTKVHLPHTLTPAPDNWWDSTRSVLSSFNCWKVKTLSFLQFFDVYKSKCQCDAEVAFSLCVQSQSSFYTTMLPVMPPWSQEQTIQIVIITRFEEQLLGINVKQGFSRRKDMSAA